MGTEVLEVGPDQANLRTMEELPARMALIMHTRHTMVLESSRKFKLARYISPRIQLPCENKNTHALFTATNSTHALSFIYPTLDLRVLHFHSRGKVTVHLWAAHQVLQGPMGGLLLPATLY